MTAMAYRYILFTILLQTVTLLPAQTITRYEYWFGNDAGSRESVIEGSENINLTISIGGLNQGLQTLNFRVQNSDGVWGPIQRMLFYVPMEPEPSATVLEWEWWFDDDVQNHKSGSGSQTTVNMEENIGSLATGLHCLNFRVRNSLGNWSPVSRFLFVKPVNPEPSTQLSDVEYWIDDGAYMWQTFALETVVATGVPLPVTYFTWRQDRSQRPVPTWVTITLLTARPHIIVLQNQQTLYFKIKYSPFLIYKR